MMDNFTKQPWICTECKTQTQWKTISLAYSQDKIEVKISGITAMVCPNCGEEYIPGPQAITLSKAVDEILQIGLMEKIAA